MCNMWDNVFAKQDEYVETEQAEHSEQRNENSRINLRGVAAISPAPAGESPAQFC